MSEHEPDDDPFLTPDVDDAIAQAEKAAEDRLWPSPLDALKRVQNRGDRIATGFPTIDENFGGGPFPGSVIVIQGKPFSGKTLLATQMCLHMGRTAAVGCLFADEGLPGAVIRMGQQMGCDKELLESGDAATIAHFERGIAMREIHLMEPEERESTLETFVEQFMRRATPTRAPVWLLDSIQTIRCDGVKPGMGETERVMTVVAQARRLAQKHGAVAKLISRMSRAGYKSKKDEENIDPMAAGRGSGDIEYGTEAILSLHGDAEERLELRCVKNRFGVKKARFNLGLMLDFARASFHEQVGDVDVAREIEQDAKRLARMARVKEKLMKEMKKHPEGLTKSEIRALTGCRPADIIASVDEMYETHVIYPVKNEGKGGGMAWLVCT